MDLSKTAPTDGLAADQRSRPRAAISDAAGGDAFSGGELDLIGRCRVRVNGLLDASAGMGVVERSIEAYALTGEEKSALWLGAWSRRYPLIGDSCDGVILAWGRRGLTRQPVLGEEREHDYPRGVKR